MGGGHLGADAGLAHGHHGVGKGDHVDAFVEQPVGHVPGQPRVSQHDRDDRVLAGHQVEAKGLQPGPETAAVAGEPGAQIGAGFDQVEDLQRGGGDGRREGVGKQVRPGALAQPLYDLPAAAGVAAAGAAECFSQGPGKHVDPGADAAVLRRSPAAFAQDSDGVGIVHHDQGVVALGQGADGAKVGDGSVHGEDAVGGDQPGPAVPGLDETAFQVGHVVVGVPQAARLAEPDPVDDAGMVQGVADDRVLFAEQGLEEPCVGVEARRIEDRILVAEESADPPLQLLVHGLGAADEADRGDPEAVAA